MKNYEKQLREYYDTMLLSNYKENPLSDISSFIFL